MKNVTLLALACLAGVWLPTSGLRLLAQSPPTIVTHPQGLIVSPGSTVTFTVEAAGDPPLSYRWRRNFTNLAGQTNASLVVSKAAACASDNVVVTNRYGAVVSRHAPLTFFTCSRATNGLALDWLSVVRQSPPLVYELQYATNLPATHWHALTNLEPKEVPFRFVDPTVGESAQRVYRAGLLPWW
jgi:hypothetical protein